ncbi:hypothetical protein [Streptomyces sp. YIM S03343]
MPPTPACGSVRSAAAVNDAIRALLSASGGRLGEEDRTVYERLLEEWSAAVQGE